MRMTFNSLPDGYTAAVFGASGGIGAALVAELAADPRCVIVRAGSRRGGAPAGEKILPFAFDLADTASIARAAETVGTPDLVIVATGMLHANGLQPEKTFRSLDAVTLERAFAVNAIGPSMIARHIFTRAPRASRVVFGALSAKVGSISDNRLGGWYSYRASKAALNQLIRTFSVELARTHPHSLCVALHPGTVDTPLSKPFQAGVAAETLFSPRRAAKQLLAVLEGLGPDSSGQLIGWDGCEISP
jgi:NAD(P)-dependent dehydrogenase (short-subunit alcohol dehydrogenase family)